jgi:hypothetical protein
MLHPLPTPFPSSSRLNPTLDLSELPQTPHRASDGRGSGRGHGPGSSSGRLLAGLAVPDSNGRSLHRVLQRIALVSLPLCPRRPARPGRARGRGQTHLSAESAGVGSVLGDLHLLDTLPQGCSISHTVLSGDSDL